MKRIIYLVGILGLGVTSLHAESTETVFETENVSLKKIKTEEGEDVYENGVLIGHTGYKKARFAEGDQALMKYVYEKTKYPQEALEKGIQGRVIVRFVVTKEGKIEDITTIRQVHPLLDQEAIRVIESMPDWIPAEEPSGKVNSYFYLPINFLLAKPSTTPKGK